jgi:hypothetical protein
MVRRRLPIYFSLVDPSFDPSPASSFLGDVDPIFLDDHDCYKIYPLKMMIQDQFA